MAALCRATILNGGCRSALLLSNAPSTLSRSSLFGVQLSFYAMNSSFDSSALASPLICYAMTWWSDAARQLQPDWQKAHMDRVQKLEALQERSPATTQEIQISKVKQPTVFEDLKKQGAEALFGGGFAQEMIIGRAAMLGFLSAMTTEIEAGCSVWQQLSVRGGLALIVMGAVLAGSLTPRIKENGLDCSANPLGPFTARAERLNGQAAMVGFCPLTCD